MLFWVFNKVRMVWAVKSYVCDISCILWHSKVFAVNAHAVRSDVDNVVVHCLLDPSILLIES